MVVNLNYAYIYSSFSEKYKENSQIILLQHKKYEKAN